MFCDDRSIFVCKGSQDTLERGWRCTGETRKGMHERGMHGGST